MTEDRKTLIRYRLQCALETMDDAEALANDGRWRSTANRLYYAAFYAIIALLLVNDLQSKKHSGVRALFLRHFVHTGTFSEELADTYKWLFDTRMKSDYTDMLDIDPAKIRNAIEPTRALITRAQELIEEEL